MSLVKFYDVYLNLNNITSAQLRLDKNNSLKLDTKYVYIALKVDGVDYFITEKETLESVQKKLDLLISKTAEA